MSDKIQIGTLAFFMLTLGACSGTPMLNDDAPANRYPVPAVAPSTNVIPDYGGTLKTDAEREATIREMEAARENHAGSTETAIKRRRY